MTETEAQIFSAAYRYLEAHADPPPTGDSALDWWERAADDLSATARSWHSHPLAVGLLAAVYEYIEQKAKENRT